MNNEKTGKLIKTLRTKKGMTQKELAEKIQVSNAAISKWENGHGFPDISLLEPLSETLDISITELINGERSLTPPAKEETTLIKDIIQLSESERKRKAARNSILTGLTLTAILILGCSGIQYLWRHQNEPLPIPLLLPGILPLLFGFLAWVIPIIHILRNKKNSSSHFGISGSFSFLFCAVSIWLPILNMDLLMRNHETGTVQDIVWGYNFASIFLLMITIILNIFSYCAYKHRK